MALNMMNISDIVYGIMNNNGTYLYILKKKKEEKAETMYADDGEYRKNAVKQAMEYHVECPLLLDNYQHLSSH